jgi:hypothetical protein
LVLGYMVVNEVLYMRAEECKEHATFHITGLEDAWSLIPWWHSRTRVSSLLNQSAFQYVGYVKHIVTTSSLEYSARPGQYQQESPMSCTVV